MYKMVVLWQCQPVCWAQDICTALYNGCSNLAKLKWSVYCHGNCSILDDKNGSKNVFFKDCVVQTEETTNPFRSRVDCMKELLIFFTLHWIIQDNRGLLAGTDFNSRTEIKKMKGSDWLMKRVYWCLLFRSKQTMYKILSWKKHSLTYHVQIFDNNQRDRDLSFLVKTGNLSLAVVMNCLQILTSLQQRSS